MSETLAHSQTTNQDIVNLAAASLSAGLDLTEAERTARSQTVIRGTMGLQPTDPAQTMLASLILGHHLAIMDGFRDIACRTLTPAEAARARMVTVAQTKLVLQMLRELRIERKDALTLAAAERSAASQTARKQAGEAGFEASLATYMAAYTETLATLEHTDPLTPAASAKAREALSQAVPPAPGAAPTEANPVQVPFTGSRAQRRAMMKRNGAFKRTA